MKVITESFLRARFRKEIPETFTVEGGQILTPAAAQLLSERKIKVTTGGVPPLPCAHESVEKVRDEAAVAAPMATTTTGAALFELAGGGGFFAVKPEHMTRLRDRCLVPRDHPRIVYRGALDSLEAELLLVQRAAFEGGRKKMVDDLGEVLDAVRALRQSEVTEATLPEPCFMGLGVEELSEQCHNPRPHVGTEHVALRYDADPLLLRLNALRCQMRVVEGQAVHAFRSEFAMQRPDAIRVLNSMSNAVYLVMLKEYAGKYR